MSDQGIERGAAEDAADAPVTPTDVEASRTPPSEPSDPEARQARDAAGQGQDDDRS
jgi:hypothetical protein